MANALTGDFDVVAEFSVLAVDRLLAAMHQTGRFLHSISAHVDDNPHPTRPGLPTVVGVVDAFGDAVADQRRIGSPNPFPGPSAVINPVSAHLGMLLNPDLLVVAPPKVVPSHISGIAQIQLFPPTVSVPDASGTNLTVRMNLMARFLPDNDSAPLAEFIRGDLQITAPINKIAAGRVHVIDIDFKADDAIIHFTPSYSSQPLATEDLVGINQCIGNGLQTSFLPSSVVLPSSIANVQLKTLPGALAVLLDLNSHPSTNASVTNVFLSGDDDFAFAVGRDYLLYSLRSVSDNILSQQFPPVTFTVDLSLWGVGTTLHYSYPIKLNTASFDLQPPDKIVLTIQGDAGPEQHGHPPDSFSFTVTVEFSLLPSGPTVGLQLGNISVDTSSTLAGIVDYFTGDVTNSVRNAVSSAIANTGAASMIDTSFNAYTNLTNFLNAQLTQSDGTPPTQPQRVFLVYNSVEIQTAGVVLHGSLIVFDWPTPYVEFEQIASSTTGPVAAPLSGGPDYSALKTWIPGGTIAQYEWSVQGQEQAYPFTIDQNKFVLLHSGPQAVDTSVAAAAVPGYSPLCLTITGSRISNFGTPAHYQPVKATNCGYTIFPIGLAGLRATTKGALPTLAITQPNPAGGVVVTGHASVQVDRSGATCPNLVVHFADTASVGSLQVLSKAISHGKHKNAPTAVIAVLTPEQLSKAPYVPGVIYAEDIDDAWQNVLELKSVKRPHTLIVSPRGPVVWQHEGIPDPEKLTAALATHLVKCGSVPITFPRLNTRIGQPAPNFLFEYAPGRHMPLTKLSGKPAVFVFWKTAVRPSIQAVRDLQDMGSGPSAPMVLAINDGDDPEVARAAAAEGGITATVVTDSRREIGLAYGVTLWPTIVILSESGIVAGIKLGHVPGEKLTLPSKPALPTRWAKKSAS
jgi:peroxiredoxin